MQNFDNIKATSMTIHVKLCHVMSLPASTSLLYGSSMGVFLVLVLARTHGFGGASTLCLHVVVLSTNATSHTWQFARGHGVLTEELDIRARVQSARVITLFVNKAGGTGNS